MRNIGHVAASENMIEVIEILIQCNKFDFRRQDRWGKSTIDLIKWSDTISEVDRKRL